MLNEMIQSVKEAEGKADAIRREGERTASEMVQGAKEEVNIMLDELKLKLAQESKDSMEQVKAEEAAKEEDFLRELDQELEASVSLVHTKEDAVIHAIIAELTEA